ncbi:HAD family hydrolase [Myroides injenensis]|uniref:HAD family hydrolase n=1 Tax=Myroides injenensis TaxID=1183151 RepID=UPI00226E34E7|nr:HAD family hydrolase [Myroides injenensis]
MKNQIRTIAFDADDTLWDNEIYYQETEKQFCLLLEQYASNDLISRKLYEVEMKNLSFYGYGVKGFMLSMIETATLIMGDEINQQVIVSIVSLGQDLLQQPIRLLNGVEDTLKNLHGQYRLVLATKGDLMDQERKIMDSKLYPFFDHVEIMNNKNEEDYRKLLSKINCLPEHFLMIGNSLKSDIEPVLALGSYAIHIPYSVTWTHEKTTNDIVHDKLLSFREVKEILYHLK